MGRIVLVAFLVICFLSVISALLGGFENIDDLSEPEVVAAANAAVQYLNRQNPPDSRELILVRIISGTQQVIMYDLFINKYGFNQLPRHLC